MFRGYPKTQPRKHRRKRGKTTVATSTPEIKRIAAEDAARNVKASAKIQKTVFVNECSDSDMAFETASMYTRSKSERLVTVTPSAKGALATGGCVMAFYRAFGTFEGPDSTKSCSCDPIVSGIMTSFPTCPTNHFVLNWGWWCRAVVNGRRTVANSTFSGFALLFLGNKIDRFFQSPVRLWIAKQVRWDLWVSNTSDKIVLDYLITEVKNVGTAWFFALHWHKDAAP
ncbi:hypothetical protein PoB_004774900 [Plakobranchus ocellatus]|uniref:Uncharacterized protein n=1 Tax=Plakobranchus ocellatus TaxID=259542 RepID=A0AAV4BM71_9GAST|nr:hypothetical protein PoB_004774900 [Plakobranchus ocellatus]